MEGEEIITEERRTYYPTESLWHLAVSCRRKGSKLQKTIEVGESKGAWDGEGGGISGKSVVTKAMRGWSFKEKALSRF